MAQQQWPFENEIRGVASLAEIRDEDREDFDPQGDTEQLVYIVEGQQLGYGSSTAWNICY